MTSAPRGHYSMTSGGRTRRTSRVALWCTMAGTGGLAALAFAYWFTYEPAPAIRVLWAPGISVADQAALERKYLFVNRRAPHPEEPRSLAYDLLDTSRSNIEALIKDPAIVDTNDVDDQWARVRLGTVYGERWMWVAHRTPLLRYGPVRRALVVLFTAMALLGVRALWARDAGAGRS